MPEALNAAGAPASSPSEPEAATVDAAVPAGAPPSPARPDPAADADRAARWLRAAAAAGPGEEAARLLVAAARCHARQGDAAGALAALRQAAEAAPDFLPAVRAARGAAAAQGDLALAASLLAREASLDEPHAATLLHLERARLLRAAGRVAEADAALAAARAVDPESAAVAEHEAALAAAEGRDGDLVAALERCAARASSPAAAAALLLDGASLAEHRLADPDRAAVLALRAFELHPGDAAVRAAARRGAEATGRADAVARVLEAEAEDAQLPARQATRALCELARVRGERLGDGEGALRALAAARSRARSDAAALEAVATAYEERQAWGDAAEALRAAAALEPGGAADGPEPGDAGGRAARALRLAALCEERLDRPEEAVACYRSALALAPGHRGALAALGRLHARAGDWEGLLRTYLAERAAARDPRERAHRAFRAAEVLREKLGRPDEAATLYAEALAGDPALVAAAQALERLHEASGRHADLAALLERQLATTADAAERVELLLRLARLREDRLSDPEGAARACEAVLAADAHHPTALRTLAALCERLGRAADAVPLLERLVARAAEAPRAVALLQRIAALQEGPLADPAAAAATHQRILALDPAHPPSLRALGRLWAQAGRWDDLVAMHRAEAEAAASAEEAAALLHRAGEILESRAADGAGAAAAYRQALTLAPAHLGALRALARVLRAAGDWEGLVETLRAEAAHAAPERQAALLAAAGQLCEEKLGDAGRALEAHEEALRAAPGFAPSQAAVERLLAAAGRWAEVVRLQRAAAVAEPPGPARAAALLRAARVLCDRLRDVAGAEAACRAALAEAPADAGALGLLSRLGAGRGPAGPGDACAGAEDAAGRAARLERERHAAAGGAARAVAALAAAEAWAEAGERARALAACEAALAAAPGDLPALELRERLHLEAGEWAAAREDLRAQAGTLRDGGLAAAALADAGELALSRLGDAASAARDWAEALRRDPAAEAVADRLAVLLEGMGRKDEACALRELRAAREADPGRSAAAWLRAAAAAEALGDGARALAALDRAVGALPASGEALLARARLLAAQGRAGDAARDLTACVALRPAAAGQAETALAASAHTALAALYCGPLADPARALSHLAAALALRPDDPAALARLAEAHRASRNWPAAADALRRLVALPGLAPGERRVHLLALADVRAEGYGDAAGAAALCRRALELDPSDEGATERLARLPAEAGDASGVMAALQAVTAASPAGADRARAHLRAARVLAGALGDPARGLAELDQAIAADPSSVEAKVARAGLLEERDPAAALEEHRRVLALDPARAASWRATFRLAQVRKAHDRAFVAAAVLRALQAAETADAAFHARCSLSAPATARGVVDEVAWRALRHAADAGPLSDILAAAGDALGAAAELAPASRERGKPAGPLARLVEELCASLGLPPFALFQAGEGAAVWVDPGDPPAVRAGADLARRSSLAEQRFLLARAAARLRARSAVAARLDARALARLLAAAVRQVDPAYEGLGVPPQAVSRAVGRALSRRARKAMEEPVRALAAGPAPDVAAWQEGLSRTADRVGLLLCGDVTAALGVVLREAAAPAPSSPEAVAGAVRDRADLRDLAVFAGSEEHLRLRQLLRLAIA